MPLPVMCKSYSGLDRLFRVVLSYRNDLVFQASKIFVFIQLKKPSPSARVLPSHYPNKCVVAIIGAIIRAIVLITLISALRAGPAVSL